MSQKDSVLALNIQEFKENLSDLKRRIELLRGYL